MAVNVLTTAAQICWIFGIRVTTFSDRNIRMIRKYLTAFKIPSRASSSSVSGNVISIKGATKDYNFVLKFYFMPFCDVLYLLLQ